MRALTPHKSSAEAGKPSLRRPYVLAGHHAEASESKRWGEYTERTVHYMDIQDYAHTYIHTYIRTSAWWSERERERVSEKDV